MDFTMIFMLSSTLVLVCFSPSAYAQKVNKFPQPDFINLTGLLTVAGPFQTFLHYLESTKVIETFQNQANYSNEGITIFVPSDMSFASIKKSTLSNLTQDQLKSICLFHALPHHYSLSEFKNLSATGPIPTFAGPDFYLNFTDKSGTVHLTSGWTNTKVISAVLSTDPVAVYQIDKVLLPEAIFGTHIPPTLVPAPAPEIALVAHAVADNWSSPKSSPPDSSSPSEATWLWNLSARLLTLRWVF